jgi:hypothetical protein
LMIACLLIGPVMTRAFVVSPAMCSGNALIG